MFKKNFLVSKIFYPLFICHKRFKVYNSKISSKGNCCHLSYNKKICSQRAYDKTLKGFHVNLFPKYLLHLPSVTLKYLKINQPQNFFKFNTVSSTFKFLHRETIRIYKASCRLIKACHLIHKKNFIKFTIQILIGYLCCFTVFLLPGLITMVY
jgi:hypothetical protein